MNYNHTFSSQTETKMIQTIDKIFTEISKNHIERSFKSNGILKSKKKMKTENVIKGVSFVKNR